MFSVGHLRDPRPDDPRFGTQREAESYARDKSSLDVVLAVWRDRDGAVLAIAYDGLVYWP
jgi:hypothetical protein